MKNLFIAVCAVCLMAASAFGQGTILFQNSADTLVLTNVCGTFSGPAVSGMAVRVNLYYSTAPTPPLLDFNSLAGWTLARETPTAVGVPLPGRFSGGTITAEDAVGGSTIWVHVRGWSHGYADWNSAVNAALSDPTILLGMTVAWAQPTGAPLADPPIAPVPLVLGPDGFNGMCVGGLECIPEPSALALAALGLAAIFIRRRVS